MADDSRRPFLPLPWGCLPVGGYGYLPDTPMVVTALARCVDGSEIEFIRYFPGTLSALKSSPTSDMPRWRLYMSAF